MAGYTWTVHDEGLTGATWAFDLLLADDGRAVTFSRNTQFTDLSNAHVSDVAVRVVDADDGSHVNTGATWTELAVPVTLEWDYGLAVNLSFLGRTSGFWRRTTGVPAGQPQGVTTEGGAVNAFRFQIGENGKLRPVYGQQTDWLVEDQETPQPTDPPLRYTTVEAVKLAMRAPTNREATTWQKKTYDLQIERIVRNAEAQIDGYCHRRFDPAPGQASLRSYRPTSLSEVDTADFVGTPTVAVSGETVDSDDFYTLPAVEDLQSPVRRGLRFPNLLSRRNTATSQFLRHTGGLTDYGEWPSQSVFDRRRSVDWYPDVSVTARWGWDRVPDAVAYAAELLSVRLFKRLSESALGIARIGEDAVFVAGGRIDPEVARSLAAYRRIGAL